MYPFSTLMCPQRFDEQSYQHILHTMAAFHLSITSLGASETKTELKTLLEPHSISTAIYQDLSQLDTHFDISQVQPLSVGSDDIHSLLALAYVWAGSSMGAQILLKWLRRNEASLPNAYYQKMAQQSGKWLQVKLFISQQLQNDEIQAETIIRYANKWFEAIIHETQHTCVSVPTDTRKHAAPL
ncbi:hypothetical protein OPS25_09685 [Alteromonas ponticola]|uniref:Heme oxygenase n=1 Tax=Alteromonas aquimaris TaxID=2998417 RepID=A0ABT3P7P0_9ALTE|nr:hypothetical protein [Alteromonas aquimaris]MCW8108764.1 hypothetical protein [Alteromonas aquimaris]